MPWDTRIEIRGDSGPEQLELLDLHPALEALEGENADLTKVLEKLKGVINDFSPRSTFPGGPNLVNGSWSLQLHPT